MRICVVSGIFPPDIGGPASYVALLSEELCSVGYSVEVVTYSSGISRFRYPFRIRRISRSIPLPVRLAVTFLEIARAASKSDLIYCNGLILPSAIASIILQKPLVMKVEGDFAWERARNLRLSSDSIEAFQVRRQNWKVEVLRGVRNWCLKRSVSVITTSGFLARLIRGWGFSGPIKVISNAVEKRFGEEIAELTREQCRKKIGISGKKIVLSAGRLVSWKGFRQVVLAAKSLPPEAVIMIIGEGPEEQDLTALIESSGLGARVSLIGKVSREELAVYLRAADCFVLNSAYEGCPHVVLEAMKVGTPVVAARTTGVPELVKHGENGLLFDRDDLGQMVSCIKQCLYGDVRDRLAAEAARRLSGYNWSNIFAQTVEVLEEAARKT